MTVYRQQIPLQNTMNKPVFHNITEQTKQIVTDSGVQAGIAVVYSRHTTCSVIIQEDSHDATLDGTPYLMQDLLNLFEELTPKCWHEGQYLHPGEKHLAHATGNLKEEGYWSLNTDGHLRSCLLGRSESIPIVAGQLELGQFGQIYFGDFDSVRQRARNAVVQIVGE